MSAQIIQFPKRPPVDRTEDDAWVQHCRDQGLFSGWDDDTLRALARALSSHTA